MSSNQPTTPRDYAAAILAEPSLDRRKLLMERCPQEWRSLVEEHVKTAFNKVVAYRQHRSGRAQLSQQKPPAAPRREDQPQPIDYRRSAPEVGNAHLAKLRAAIGKGAA
ncbi:hypothetical protein [Pseudomonas segetis]|uniref:Uncharacterized protein n=1 Tax=Pseudomonas segetis TaxID=298908 RepID=A0A239JNI6_9PSED|nr:hypothetical protein [Pseudomonas segetis]SNT07329.1 hypothetical protein SAMN05216255_4427 [Pseudomonas segetis]